jgi:spore coat protein U-like protein
MKKFKALTLATFLVSSFAFAGSTSSDTTLTLTTQPGCVIQNSPALNIEYTGLVDATGSFDLQLICDSGVNYTITVGDGLNASGGVRRASDGAGHFIAYRLYSDSAMTTELGVGTNNTVTGTGDATTQTITFYGAVKMADNTSAVQGMYNDTLTLTVSW